MPLPDISPRVGQLTFVERWFTNPRAVLGYSLLLGALPGAWGWLQMTIATELTSSIAGIGLTILALGYFAVTGYAGVLLLRRSPRADYWAIAALIPQLVQLQTPQFFYKAASGLHATLTVNTTDWRFGVGVLSSFWLQITDLPNFTQLAINFVPVLFLSYLYRRRAKPPN